MFIPIGWLLVLGFFTFALGALTPIVFIIRRVSRTGTMYKNN